MSILIIDMLWARRAPRAEHNEILCAVLRLTILTKCHFCVKANGISDK